MTNIKSKTLKLDLFVYLKALFDLMKPRVMSLVIFTCVVGLLIAPVKVDFWNAFVSILAVALGSGAAGALNMWYEADLDSAMTRTCLRPIPTGKVTKKEALIFGILAANSNIVAILGPLSTSGSISASAAVSQMNIPLILPTASRMGLTHVGDNVLQLNSTLFQQGRYAAEYAVSELNVETIAVVAPQDRFGKELTDGFLEKADALGAEVVTVEWYRGIPIDIGVQLSSLREVAFELAIPDTEIVITDAVLDTLDDTFIVEEMDFFPEEVAVEEDEDVDSTKIVLSSIDAVYLPIHTGDIQYVASQFSALLLETQLVGNGSWYDPLELSDDLISENVDGMIILSNLVEPKHNNSQNQLIFFQDDFATRREFLMAMAGFDAVEFLAANLGSKPSRTKLMTSFESPQFYRGTSRIYSFTEQSPKVNSASSILQYHRGKFVTVAEIIADSLVSIIPSAP